MVDSEFRTLDIRNAKAMLANSVPSQLSAGLNTKSVDIALEEWGHAATEFARWGQGNRDSGDRSGAGLLAEIIAVVDGIPVGRNPRTCYKQRLAEETTCRVKHILCNSMLSIFQTA